MCLAAVKDDRGLSGEYVLTTKKEGMAFDVYLPLEEGKHISMPKKIAECQTTAEP